MGREVRKVAANWEHPKVTDGQWTWGDRRLRVGQYMTLHDRDFETVAAEWKSEFLQWNAGTHPDQKSYPESTVGKEFWEYHGPPPDRKYYRPKWSDAERTHYQLYETVSEGTPLSPSFPTLEELARWLATNGDYWSQQRGDPRRSFADWMAFLRVGWAPSGVFSTSTGVYVQGDIAFADENAKRN